MPTLTETQIAPVSLNNDDVCYQDGGNSYILGYSNGAQKAWLEKELKATRANRDIDWIIVVGLVLGGSAVLYLDGMTKNSIVAGPILIASGIAWALHDRWHVTWFVLMPMLLVLLGVLMLIARRPNIPERRARQT